MLGAEHLVTGGVQTFLTGNLDEIALFSDTLSASQITTIYNGGRTYNVLSFPNIVGYWQMSEGLGTTVSDSKGSIVFDFAAAPADPAWVFTGGYENRHKRHSDHGKHKRY